MVKNIFLRQLSKVSACWPMTPEVPVVTDMEMQSTDNVKHSAFRSSARQDAVLDSIVEEGRLGAVNVSMQFAPKRRDFLHSNV